MRHDGLDRNGAMSVLSRNGLDLRSEGALMPKPIAFGPTKDDLAQNPEAPPEANYRRLSTAALVALRAELIAVHTQRHVPMSPRDLATLRAQFPMLEFPEDDPTPEADPFFVARVACIDRILAERERVPDA